MPLQTPTRHRTALVLSVLASLSAVLLSLWEGMTPLLALALAAPGMLSFMVLRRGGRGRGPLLLVSALLAWLICLSLLPFFLLGLYFLPAAVLLTAVYAVGRAER